MRLFNRRKFTLILLFASFMFCYASHAKEPVTSIQQLNSPEYTVAVSTAGIMLDAVKEELPNAKIFYAMGDEGYYAVQMGKADAYAYDRAQMEIAIANGLKGVRILPGSIGEKVEIAIGISRTSKIPNLKQKVNQFVSEIKSSGTFQDMFQRWVMNAQYAMPDIDVPSSSELKLVIGTIGLLMPYSYYEGNILTGFDIELGRRFAAWLGAEIEFRIYSFGGLIAAAVTGDIDCIMADLNILPERAERIDFSDTLFTEDVALLVKDDTASQSSAISRKYASISEFDGKRLGIMTGTLHDAIIHDVLPSAEVFYFDNEANMVASLTGGKIDGAVNDDVIIMELERKVPELRHVDGYLKTFENAFVFAKTPESDKLRNEMNEFIRQLKSDGTLKKIHDLWTGDDESLKVPDDYENYPAANGTLRIAVDPQNPPFNYLKDGKAAGYEVDIVLRFCKAKGYKPEIVLIDFGAIIPSIKTGKTDVGIGAITVTEERKESVNFSEPVMTSGSMILARKDDLEPKSAKQDKAKYTSISDLEGKRIAIQTGTNNPEIAAASIPNAQLEYYDTMTDILTALKLGKVEAFVTGLNAVRYMMIENDDIAILDKPLKESRLAPIFPKTEKGEKLCAEFSEFIKAQWEDGTIDELDSIWFGRDDDKRTAKDYAALPATNGTLKMAVDLSIVPFAYIKDNKIVGYDVDMAFKFCESHGYGLEIVPMSFGGFIPALQSGKCDFAECSIAYTEERAEQVLFASPNARGGNVAVVRKSDTLQRSSAGYDDLAGKRIAVVTGSALPDVTLKHVPTAKLVYFDTLPDTLTALRAGKVDAACTFIPMARMIMAEDDGIAFLGEQLTNTDCGPIFAKNEHGMKLCEQFSEFIKTQWDNGTIQEIDSIWFGNDESRKIIKDYTKLPAANGTLKLAAELTVPPCVYVKDNKIVGYDIDCVVRFCEAYGYGLEIVPMNFAGLIPAIQSGKFDFGICGIARTPEREESVLFSYPNLKAGNAFVVMKSDIESHNTDTHEYAVNDDDDKESFIDEIKASFERTFIREDRWKLFVEGIISTMIITVLSILFGTILGFIVYLSCRGGNVIANLMTRFFVWLIQGMPMVVLLMILYYIVFGKVNIAGTWVAVIAFTLTFGSGVYGMLWSGVGALDRGQIEAAYALGFTDRRAFFTIILPQAALHFMPAYKAEVVALIKATAIVGYIAVQDLTKMGDIVRSRTYEAFFPLIAVAVIYFILAGMLNVIVGVIHNRIRPEKRTKNDILRGIEIHD